SRMLRPAGRHPVPGNSGLVRLQRSSRLAIASCREARSPSLSPPSSPASEPAERGMTPGRLILRAQPPVHPVALARAHVSILECSSRFNRKLDCALRLRLSWDGRRRSVARFGLIDEAPLQEVTVAGDHRSDGQFLEASACLWADRAPLNRRTSEAIGY